MHVWRFMYPMTTLILIYGSLAWSQGSGAILKPNPSKLHQSLSRIKRRKTTCEGLIKKDGSDRPKPPEDEPEPDSCKQGTPSCWRGLCFEGRCRCCLAITPGYIEEYPKLKIKKPYGRWQGDKCDQWQEWDEDGNPIDPLDATTERADETPAQPVDEASLKNKEKLAVLADGAERPTPTKDDIKKRPKKCNERTASCWRGHCDVGQKECFKCYTYDLTDVGIPGRYFGEYCDQFAADYLVLAEKTADLNFNCKQFCQNGVCLWFPVYTKEVCICDYGFNGQFCDFLQKKSLKCYNRGKSKSIKTKEGKAKYCRCKDGYGGLQCERPGVCLDSGGNSLCLTGTCERASLRGGGKGWYCKCPKDKKLKVKGPYCKPKNYRKAAGTADPESGDTTEGCGPHQLQCVNGVCEDEQCVCSPGFDGEVCDQPLTDENNNNRQVVVAVPARFAFAGEYKDEMSNPRSPMGAAIRGSLNAFMAELSGRVNNILVSKGSVLIDFDAQFDSEGTADEPDTDFKQLLEDEMKNQEETFDAGLGAEYKFDLKASKVGQPQLRFVGNDTFDKTPGYGVLAGLVVLVLFVIAAIITIMKINANKKAEEKKKKKDKKNKKNKKDKKSNQSLKTRSSVETDKLSSKSSTKSTSLKSKSSGKSDGLKSKTSVKTGGLKSKTSVKNTTSTSFA